ncbi:uncharacterized protein L969DRAFT_89174 [Mixia osmundae IAM 14324]|uniref:Tetratricopeptide SHNi-TPR domain-containing protein n=1 Tax=Mixia osmundae (strain CBS 9802 / IAM 14324 / JCM 22182 / KY 12970) TaxID=764103 RepID=G7DSK4_MIXOS|nr:uncharacterized protein L969DRAFT_89174 [Mixia osmundae IAM 14324]KEI37939.1 hypothetical protein L969DRAFT_89174 [Mixia osmundae IAM 14324]GAA93564.1 hypothetical protein E5Q_00208 [Mixia osmundae IAM 14324]
MADSIPTADEVSSFRTVEEAPEAVLPEEKPSVTAETASEAPVNIEALIQLGDKQSALTKYRDAAETYSTAAEALREKHGDLHMASVPVLIRYGRALLRGAIQASGVLGSSAPATAPAEPAQAKQAKPVGKLIELSDDEDDEPEEEAQEEAAPANGEDEDDLSMAWNVLDTVRVTLLRAIDASSSADEKRLHQHTLVRVHELLAEVATEEERFEEAAQEYVAATEIQTIILPDHSRNMASTHYLAALTFEQVISNPAQARDAAVKHAAMAKTILEKRLALLDGRAATAAEREKAEDEAESDDIRPLLSEIDEKINDLKTMEIGAGTAADAILRDALAVTGQADLSKATQPTGPVNSLQVKKKPKAAQATTAKRKASPALEEDSKKQKTGVEDKQAKVEDARDDEA